MTIKDNILSNEEKISLELRSLYSSFDYERYRMRRFEEYSFYENNRDFLPQTNMITFTESNGKIFALKPDVTLSIVKNYCESKKEDNKKLQYHESVFRINRETKRFNEVFQSGVEMLGDIKDDKRSEIVFLAAESLLRISNISALNISDMGIIKSTLSKINNSLYERDILNFFKLKNSNGLKKYLSENKSINKEIKDLLMFLIGEHIDIKAIEKEVLKLKIDNEITKKIVNLIAIAKEASKKTNSKINLDFSQIVNMNYYDGLILTGFVKEVPTPVLTGGQYGELLKKMGSKKSGLGFAVELNLLEHI